MKKLFIALFFVTLFVLLFSFNTYAAQPEHTVAYYDGDKLLKTVYVTDGQKANDFIPPEKIGYDFVLWQKDGTVYDFDTPISEDITLYAEYMLTAPTYALNDKSFIYDGKEQMLAFDNLYHPLEASGFYNMQWYKDGEFISSSLDGIVLQNVSDTGEYYCKLTFTYLGDSITVETNKVSVSIKKAEITVPQISTKEYNGKVQYADIVSSSRFSIQNGGGVDVGKYEVVLTLTDKDNYTFVGGADTVTLDFEIVKAQNSWVEPLSAQDYYLYRPNSPFAVPMYGEVVYFYSTAPDGEYSQERPEDPGKYYVKAVVDESDNYLSIHSEPVEFTVLEEMPSGISVKAMPNKTVYTAFETLNTDGLEISLSYNSGRVELLSPERYTIIYNNQDNVLLCRDTSILISYAGLYVSIPVEVKRADFDMSGVYWVYNPFTYDGSEKSVYLEGLPIGLNAIYTDNSKIGAGKYTALAEFSFDEENYNAPTFHPLVWEIAPREVILLADSITLNFGESEDSLTYKVISGSVIEGDALNAFLWHDADSVYISADNPNYKIECIEGRVNYIIPKSDSIEQTIIYICFAFIIMVLLLMLAQKSKKAHNADNSVVKNENNRNTAQEKSNEEIPKHFDPTNYFNGQRVFTKKRKARRTVAIQAVKRPFAPVNTEQCEQSETGGEIVPSPSMAIKQLNRIIANETAELGKRENIKSILSVDVKKADSLISNTLAKSLLHKSEEVIITNGNKRAVVNIDILSKNFEHGDRVDINTLKAKKLVSKDAGYLKILSRGHIDKPLTVYASDFSLSAVKMIALTGGEAIKCTYKQEKIQSAKYKEQKNS